MGYQRVLVTMSARSRVTGETCGGMRSPDIDAFLQGQSQVPSGCLSYTALGSNVLVVDPPRLSDEGIELILDAAVHGDGRAYDETRRFIANLNMSSDIPEMKFLDAAWFFFQGEWSDPRLVDVDSGSVHRWVRVIREWARFELSGDVEGTMAKTSEFAATREIRDLSRLLEARVRLEEEDVTTAAQLADGALQNLMVQCRLDFEACTWVPLAEWVLGQALSSTEGREDEAEAMLKRAADHAPGTWIATSLTQ